MRTRSGFSRLSPSGSGNSSAWSRSGRAGSPRSRIPAGRLTWGAHGDADRRLLALEVGVARQTLFVGPEDVARLVQRDLSRPQRRFRRAAQALHEVVALVAHVAEHLRDRVALLDVIDEIAAALSESDLHVVGVAEEVVQVSEDLLVGPHEEDAQVVFLPVERMQFEHVTDVAAVGQE